MNEVMDLQSPEIKGENDKEKKTIYIDFKIKLNKSEPASKKIMSRKANPNVQGQLKGQTRGVAGNRSFNVR